MIYEVQVSGDDMDSVVKSPVWTTVYSSDKDSLAKAFAQSIAQAYPCVRVMPIKPVLVFDHGIQIFNLKTYIEQFKYGGL